MKEITEIAELRKIQLDILKHIDVFCKENQIKYFLSGGTMIGAVRHHGYIPWDDDIDIMMLRNDYEKFISLYTDKDKSKYKIHYYADDKSFTFPFVKIDNSDTIIIEKAVNKVENLGINVDLFPIDVIPNEKQLQRKLYSRTSLIMNLLTLKDVVPSKERSWYKNLILYISRVFLWPVPMITLVRKLDENALKYRNVQSDFCGVAVWGYGLREINLRKNWDNVIEVPFEDMMAPVPGGYDNYLSCVYGDYMQLPPEDKRVTHHGFKAWWK